MTYSLDLTRPKAAPNNALAAAMAVGTPAITDAVGSETIFIPFNLTGQDPPSFTIASCTTTNGSTTVTTTNSFAGVKVGDVVSGTGIPGGATVTAIATNTSLTISANATASGSVTLTFDPPAISAATVYGIRITHSASGSATTVSVDFLMYDGSLGSILGTAANATRIIPLVPSSGSSGLTIDYDQFLSTLRVPRS